ncbi:unnamed protein product [Agarophyton chilense]
MTSAPPVAVMAHDVDHNHHAAPPPPEPEPEPEPDADAPQPQSQPPQPSDPPKQKTPGSSRRGKQYKCGHCHELGHNQKTCPRRTSVANEAHSIQPALEADLFGPVTGGVAPALVGNGHQPPPGPITRVQPAKIDAALEAANKRVVAADNAVASAKTEQEFEEATAQLDTAVRSLEKVASLVHRCAVVAHTLQGNWDIAQSAVVERETKRMRMDTSSSAAVTPTATTMPPASMPATSMALNDATAAAATEAVEAQQVVVSEPKEEQHLE